ncbi:hypothetical protein LINPERPRIM_LOCUS23778 [Linum perenne]
MSTQNTNSITITTYKGNLSEHDVNRMITDARVVADQDKKEKGTYRSKESFQ